MFDDLARRMAETMDAEIEKQLLDMFGSLEDAKRFAHLFTIEFEPVQTEAVTDGNTSFRATQRWRLRLKTEDERADD